MIDERAILQEPATPKTQFFVVDVIYQGPDYIRVAGNELPTDDDGDILDVSRSSVYDLKPLPPAYEDLDPGHYLRSHTGDDLVIRDLSDVEVWSTVYDIPEAARIPDFDGSRRGGRA